QPREVENSFPQCPEGPAPYPALRSRTPPDAELPDATASRVSDPLRQRPLRAAHRALRVHDRVLLFQLEVLEPAHLALVLRERPRRPRDRHRLLERVGRRLPAPPRLREPLLDSSRAPDETVHVRLPDDALLQEAVEGGRDRDAPLHVRHAL